MIEKKIRVFKNSISNREMIIDYVTTLATTINHVICLEIGIKIDKKLSSNSIQWEIIVFH